MQDQFLGAVDAVTSPDLQTPSGGPLLLPIAGAAAGRPCGGDRMADIAPGQLCNLVDRSSRFGMSSKLSDIGFRILSTSDFLFGLLSQLLLLILKFVVAQEICFATIQAPKLISKFCSFYQDAS